MATKARELETPFRKGERVLATRDLHDVERGTRGRIKVANGLGNWRRYWVMFNGGRVMGQVSHHDLVRPDQLGAWTAREEERELAALRSEEEVALTAAAAADGGGGDDVASRIPANLLERSRAAKKRLLG
jgi:hypothetical protein